MEGTAVKPDLGVLECFGDFTPCETFAVVRIAVSSQALSNILLLVWFQPPRGLGIVGDEQISQSTNDDGKDALLVIVSKC